MLHKKNIVVDLSKSVEDIKIQNLFKNNIINSYRTLYHYNLLTGSNHTYFISDVDTNELYNLIISPNTSYEAKVLFTICLLDADMSIEKIEELKKELTPTEFKNIFQSIFINEFEDVSKEAYYKNIVLRKERLNNIIDHL